MVPDDAAFLLTPLRKNYQSEKLVVKVGYDLKHDIIVVSKDIFVQKEYLLEETPLEEPCDEEVVEVMPHVLELINQISIKCPRESIPTSIILPFSSLFDSFMDPSMSIFLEFKTCMMYASDVD